MESPKIMASELPVLDEKSETVDWTRNQRRPTLHNAYSMPSLVVSADYQKATPKPGQHSQRIHSPKPNRKFPKPEHHRSLQQLAEQLSEIPKKFQIFPATWQKLSKSEKFCHWLKVFSEISNIHGMKWHLYVKKKPLKILCVLFIFFVIFAIPAILIYEALYFFSPVAINTALVLEKSDKMKYPNVTVCFAQFFDKTLLEQEEISNDLANYLTMALDPNAANIFELMSQQIENYLEKMMDLEDQLDQILASRNISIVELFHKIAIRCENFISLCDIHGQYLFSSPDTPPDDKCCGVFFNPNPIFVNTGTCFTSYQEV